MDYSYVFLILLLPALSFLVVGLLGMKMSHKVAGLIGTCSLAAVTILCYYTAIEYFLIAGREGQLYPTVTAFDMTWLRFTDLLTFHIGFRLTPISYIFIPLVTCTGRKVSNVIMLSFHSSPCRCSGSLWLRTSSKCICSGNL